MDTQPAIYKAKRKSNWLIFVTILGFCALIYTIGLLKMNG